MALLPGNGGAWGGASALLIVPIRKLGNTSLFLLASDCIGKIELSDEQLYGSPLPCLNSTIGSIPPLMTAANPSLNFSIGMLAIRFSKSSKDVVPAPVSPPNAWDRAFRTVSVCGEIW